MDDQIDRTSDGHYIIVNGRKWRATNPYIPASLRTELVKELMSARRAVKDAAGDPEKTAAARRRVQNAKVALGERGDPWWEPLTNDGMTERIQASIRALLTVRDPSSSICPSDVARVVGSPDWRPRMDDVRAVGAALASAGEITVTQRGEPVAEGVAPSGPIRYTAGPNFERT